MSGPGPNMSGALKALQSSIKVITITGLIILGIVLDLGGMFLIQYLPCLAEIYLSKGGPTHDRIGFRYWKNPGPFVQFAGIEGNPGRFLAWWAVMTQAAFSFIGTEIVAVSCFFTPVKYSAINKWVIDRSWRGQKPSS